jgi:imidazolonepropionase-like amidohydrolase
MGKFAINNVLVFNGETVSGPGTIIIDGGVIGSDPTGAEVVDGKGCMILPGLIDSHVHIANEDELRNCVKYGVTTVCDLGAFPKQLFEKMKGIKGTTEYLSSGLAAFPPTSMHAHFYTTLDKDMSLKSEGEVAHWVQSRVSEGVDFIKIIADEPGFNQATLNKIGSEARAMRKLTIAHGTHYGAYQRGLDAGYDILTHVPLEKVVDEPMIQQMVAQGTVSSPTLFMMKLMVESDHFTLPGAEFNKCLQGVGAMYRAGVPILAGTDSNLMEMPVHHGASIHDEMGLLVDAGLQPIDALRGATSLTAKHFGLEDRGRIAVGLKADLVLVEGEPTANISDSRNIMRVWKDGVEVTR